MSNMLTTVGQLEIFSEDSVIGFDRWSENFEIYLLALGRNWTEQEKVARLGLALKDTPREIFRKLTNEEKSSVKNALKALREKLNSPHRRELARRTLALCKQKEDESIAQFLRRLTPLIEIVNSTLTEEQRKEKICQEFLDRMRPSISFLIKLVGLSKTKDLDMVKAQAEELELLLATEKSSNIAGMVPQTIQSMNVQWKDQMENQCNDVGQNECEPDSNDRPEPQSYERQSIRDDGNYQRNFRSNTEFEPEEYEGNNCSRARNQANQQSQSRNWSNRPRCDYCGRIGHVEYQCWDKQEQLQAGTSNSNMPQANMNANQPLRSQEDSELIIALAQLVLKQYTPQNQHNSK